MNSTELTLDNIKDNIQLVKELYNSAQNNVAKANGQSTESDNSKYLKCLEEGSKIIKFLDSLNPFQVNRLKEEVKTIYYINAELLTRTVGLNPTGRANLSDHEKGVLYTAAAHLQKTLNVDPFDNNAKELFKIVLIFLTIFNSDIEENIKILNNVLTVHPCDYQLHYNLGFMYHRANELEKSLSHYKLAHGIIELSLSSANIDQNRVLKEALIHFKIKTLNGLGSIYYSVQDRDLANYFFYKALDIAPDDPDINNQLGVVYTELRFTDKAIKHYKHGIANVDKAHISTDKDMLIASMYMNMGLAYCYEINYPEAINCYNKALQYKPRLSLAYQNKLLDMNYISHLIDDPMYIANLHKNLNKIYPIVVNNYKESCPNYRPHQKVMKAKSKRDLIKNQAKINIGFVSGDYICHPVSYFISSILKYINYDIFNVYCYSLKVVKLTDMYPKINWRVVKGTSPEQLKNIIQGDSIDMLFDLSSQTGDNRLDTFVLKPAPIQISYCGYPNTSGLSNMDYHIVDHFCDSDGKTPGPGGVVRSSTQKYYTEKLLYMKHSFLSYTPSIGINNLPALPKEQPITKNSYLTIGSFNRYNKVNDTVIAVWEKLLERCPNVKFIIKTKEFLTPTLREQFLNTWKNKEILKRVEIVEYSDTYQEHLDDYNLMDIAVDTFPYSGTTTSCEALMMGVPVLTLFDSDRQYHSQNVTSSLMINSDLPEYVAYSEDEYIEKIHYWSNHPEEIKNLKKDVRNKFVNGHVCNYKEFVGNFEDKLIETYKNHKWK
jgi:protein O-GlcNAc transferase